MRHKSTNELTNGSPPCLLCSSQREAILQQGSAQTFADHHVMLLQELSQLPDNDVTAEYVDAMAAAVQEYGVAQAIVLFVVQPGEKNSYDQQVCLLLRIYKSS